MKHQKLYTTDQVIEIINSIKGPDTPPFAYANKVAKAIIYTLESQRPVEAPEIEAPLPKKRSKLYFWKR